MHKVCVLLSTYNGEKYLRDQINSVLCQKNVDISILIRDDGSKDSTISIIQDYLLRNSNIFLVRGANIGPSKSFLTLLSLAPDAEYYAFCDQDDVWMDEKLYKAIKKIREVGEDKPVLYYSNLTLTDAELNPIKRTNIKVSTAGKSKRFIPFVDNIGTGCTMVMNQNLKALIISSLPDAVSMHDAWCNIVCSIFGEVIIDSESYIYYRQHENNTIGMDTKFNIARSTRLHLERLTKKNLQPRLMNATSFLECFGERMDEDDKKKVLKIVLYKKSLLNRISLLFDFSIRSYSVTKDLRYRLLILAGEI